MRLVYVDQNTVDALDVLTEATIEKPVAAMLARFSSHRIHFLFRLDIHRRHSRRPIPNRRSAHHIADTKGRTGCG